VQEEKAEKGTQEVQEEGEEAGGMSASRRFVILS
jgi:hypothetical protein